MFNFEKLDVWQKSIGLADLTCQLTKSFPVDERFGLTNQMRPAAVSIFSTLAEGCSRESKTDFRRFIEIAVDSAFELVSQTRVAQIQGWLNTETNAKIYGSALEVVRMLSGRRDSLEG